MIIVSRLMTTKINRPRCAGCLDWINWRDFITLLGGVTDRQWDPASAPAGAIDRNPAGDAIGAVDSRPVIAAIAITRIAIAVAAIAVGRITIAVAAVTVGRIAVAAAVAVRRIAIAGIRPKAVASHYS